MEIAEGRSVDLMEVDAASRTKVEDTRELLDNVQYAPTRSRYKVYLIDEVHMLSSHSFNALLKTLEEPPPHVKFLLATTDPQKLPATVLSRCLQFNLKNMPPQQVATHLEHVLTEEKIEYDEPALWLLGRAAAGSMRDALSLTDQAIAFGAGSVREADVRSMLGSVDLSFGYQLLRDAIAGDASAVLGTITRMAEHAPDFEGSLDELVSLLHRVAIAQAVPDAVDNSWGDASQVSEIAASMSPEDAQLFYQVALNGKRDIGLAADPRSGFEMILLRMIVFRPSPSIDPDAPLAEPVSGRPQSLADNVAGEVDPTPKKLVEQDRAVMPASPSPAPVTPPTGGKGSTKGSDSSTKGSDSLVGAGTTPTKGSDSLVEAGTTKESDPLVGDEAGSAQATAGRASEPEDSAPEQSAGAASESETGARKNLDWLELIDLLELKGALENVAANCELLSRENQVFRFVLDRNNAGLFNPRHEGGLRAALEKFFGEALTVTIIVGDLKGQTPSMARAQRALERQAAAETELAQDPRLKGLIDRFDGELDRSSIVPLDYRES